MVALYIIGAIALLIFALMMVRGELIIKYGDELSLCVNIHGIKIGIIPKKEKKIKINDYTPSKYAKIKEKRAKKAEKKAAKKASKKAEKAQKKEEEEKNPKKKSRRSMADILDTVSLIKDIVLLAVGRFARHLRIRVARLHIKVASDDAAKTAIMYGAIAQSITYISSALNATKTLKAPERADVCLTVDYLSEKLEADIEVGLSIKVWQIFDILFKVLGRYLGSFFKK